jgi:antitoxin component HigA of HigAB toxin-antitoxin module
MSKLTTSITREIIDDFEKQIKNRKTVAEPPRKTVIDFRNERKKGIERKVCEVPIELLRYRKDNGRITSDIISYEKYFGKLDETDEKHQEIIRNFLNDKDPEKTEELKLSILHDGQREPAIITCDGFLINGNRRKMVLEELLKKYPGDRKKYNTMRVVILPGKDDEGGAPTLLEIEQIENRYQLQSDGKAEYYGFDKALSMKRKIGLGMTLEEQLRDDSKYALLDDKEFKKAIKNVENEYLKPIECIDRYLENLKREGLYYTVSAGITDKEGRWEAFKDYSKFYQQLKDGKRRIQLSISESEIGKIEDISFKIIRMRELPSMGKVHKIMRDLPKLIENNDSKKELLKLANIDLDLPREQCVDKDGKEYNEREKDNRWGEIHRAEITRQVKKAVQLLEFAEERETPINLLEDALKKLNHKNMDTKSISTNDIQKAMDLTREIRKRAQQLESELYHNYKKLKKLAYKNKN